MSSEDGVVPPAAWDDLTEAYAHAEAEEVRQRIHDVEHDWWGENGAVRSHKRKVKRAAEAWLSAELAAAERRGAVRALREAAEELHQWVGLGADDEVYLGDVAKGLKIRADREEGKR